VTLVILKAANHFDRNISTISLATLLFGGGEPAAI
jgi:hypothetical protein